MMGNFLKEIGTAIKSEIDFTEFEKVASKLCLSASQMRMAITKTAPSKTGSELVKSQVSTVIIGFLSAKEQYQA